MWSILTKNSLFKKLAFVKSNTSSSVIPVSLFALGAFFLSRMRERALLYKNQTLQPTASAWELRSGKNPRLVTQKSEAN